ncbi:hypothetical protein K8O92_15925 [Nocardia asteroides]|nr:hypothetical protein K8O92_15925 [Nocardia asteroides]
MTTQSLGHVTVLNGSSLFRPIAECLAGELVRRGSARIDPPREMEADEYAAFSPDSARTTTRMSLYTLNDPAIEDAVFRRMSSCRICGSGKTLLSFFVALGKAKEQIAESRATGSVEATDATDRVSCLGCGAEPALLSVVRALIADTAWFEDAQLTARALTRAERPGTARGIARVSRLADFAAGDGRIDSKSLPFLTGKGEPAAYRERYDEYRKYLAANGFPGDDSAATTRHYYLLNGGVRYGREGALAGARLMTAATAHDGVEVSEADIPFHEHRAAETLDATTAPTKLMLVCWIVRAAIWAAVVRNANTGSLSSAKERPRPYNRELEAFSSVRRLTFSMPYHWRTVPHRTDDNLPESSVDPTAAGTCARCVAVLDALSYWQNDLSGCYVDLLTPPSELNELVFRRIVRPRGETITFARELAHCWDTVTSCPCEKDVDWNDAVFLTAGSAAFCWLDPRYCATLNAHRANNAFSDYVTVPERGYSISYLVASGTRRIWPYGPGQDTDEGVRRSVVAALERAYAGIEYQREKLPECVDAYELFLRVQDPGSTAHPEIDALLHELADTVGYVYGLVRTGLRECRGAGCTTCLELDQQTIIAGGKSEMTLMKIAATEERRTGDRVVAMYSGILGWLFEYVGQMTHRSLATVLAP